MVTIRFPVKFKGSKCSFDTVKPLFGLLNLCGNFIQTLFMCQQYLRLVIRNAVAASLTDCGKYFRCYPTLEFLCGIQFAAEDEGVDATFVDDGKIGISFISVTNRDGILIFLVNVVKESLSCIRVSKCISHILANKPRLTVHFNGSHCHAVIIPNSNLVHNQTSSINLINIFFLRASFISFCIPREYVLPNTHSSSHLLIRMLFILKARSRSSGLLSLRNCGK